MNKKYFLGIDLGVTSVGWAISSDKDGVLDFGVQVWEKPHIPRKKITHAEKRREYRHSLRRWNRKRTKKRLLKNFLNSNVFLDISRKIPKDFSIGRWVHNLNNQLNVYDLIYESIFNNKKLNDQELAWVLLKYLNKRGPLDVISEDDKKLTIPDCDEKIIKLQETIKEKKQQNKKVDMYEETLIYWERRKKALEVEKSSKFPVQIIKEEGKEKSHFINQKYWIKDRLFTRKTYERECRALLESQQLNKELINEIINIIFTQLFFEDAPDPLHGKTPIERQENRLRLIQDLKEQQKIIMQKKEKTNEDYRKIKQLRERRIALHHYLPPKEQRGKCSYYPFEDRCPDASIIRSLYSYCQEMNNKKIIEKNNKENKFPSSKFQQLIIDFFKYSNDKLIKIMKNSSKFWTFLNENVINPLNKTEKIKRLDYFKVENIIDFSFISSLEVNKKDLKNFIDKICDFDKKVSFHFSDFTTLKYQYDALRHYLKKDKINNIDEYSKLMYKSFSTSNLSLRIMYEAIIAFINGKTIGEFLDTKRFYTSIVKKENLPKSLDNTFIISKMLNSTNSNSTVFRALTNVRRLIKDIHVVYRDILEIPNNKRLFETINIEISSGFLLTKTERDAESNRISSNEKERKTIENIILKNDLLNNSNTKMLVKLFLEQKGKVDKDFNQIEPAICLLSAKEKNLINLKDIKYNRVENGHIISEKYGIHHIKNRFIVKKELNREQGNDLPYKFLLEKHPDRVKFFKSKIDSFYKTNPIKKALFFLKTEINNERFDALKDELSQTELNDTRYIAKIVFHWLSSELVKRDYILNGCTLVDGKGREYSEYDYEKWWDNKIIEMRNSRINQVLGLTTSFIRRNCLFSPIVYDEYIASDSDIRAWAYNHKGKIKELTNWDHAIDGMALSLIQDKEALFFYQFYSNALRRYWEMKNIYYKEKILEKSKELRVEFFKKLYKEMNEYKNSIITFLKEKGRVFINKNDGSIKWKNKKWGYIINKSFNDLKITDEIVIKKGWGKPDFSFEKFKDIKNCIDEIPVKLKWYKMNELSYSIFNFFCRIKDNQLKWIQDKNNLDTIIKLIMDLLESKLDSDNFYKKVKEKSISNERLAYMLFVTFISEYRKKSKEVLKDSGFKIISFLDKFKRLIVLLSELDKPNKNVFVWSVYSALIDKNKQKKKEIDAIIFTNKVANFHLRTYIDIFVDSLDLNPKKVIKHIYDGKLKHLRSLTSSENPIRFSNEGRRKEKHEKDDLVLKIFDNWKMKDSKKIIEIEKKITSFRKNPSQELKNKINDELKHYYLLIDKFGSLWKINSFIGFTINKTTREVKAISSYEFNEKCLKSKNEKFTNDHNELIIFGRERYIYIDEKDDKKSFDLYKNYFKYPCMCASMQNVKKNSIYIEFNGISNKGLTTIKNFVIKPYKDNNLIYWQMKNISCKYPKILFNGNIERIDYMIKK